MTARQPCPPAPGPLEEYTAQFDPLFTTLAQRRSFHDYLTGLLLPRDRHKTLTALAGAEPIVDAKAAPVQRLQFFLSEATWDAEAVTAQRLALLTREAATAPHASGVLVIDDTGDRKAGTATAHVARQYLGSVGKVDTGLVAVTTLWADERLYYPLHVEPYTPAGRLRKGKADPAFRTKPQIARELVARAQAAGIPFRAVVADAFYGENEDLEAALAAQQIPYVLGRKPATGHWAPADQAHTFAEAAATLPRGAWTKVVRRFKDRHRESWWTAELRFAGYGPERGRRALVATTDPARLPPLSTWYLTTNLPAPGRRRRGGPPPADLAELVRLYGLRVWVEQSYKQVKQELGWADFMVRSDRAIRRHWALVCCAFAFCWWSGACRGGPSGAEAVRRGKNRGQRAARRSGRSRAPGATPLVAGRAAARARLARPLAVALALLGGVVRRAPTTGARRAAGLSRHRTRAQPLPPVLTKYR